MSRPDWQPDELALRRRRSRRTALVVGVIAVLIYAGFILSGVLAH
ncbi:MULTISPECIES: hypothetical protein [Stenotrophomonas]|jgi:hypothetical protein|uniref:Uncharacterized protein n=1 Tax=Stenotrophomonas acidaminiphila TaxID=128780 RepID=A0A0S1AUT6_9GAMM|nr:MULTISPECIES: hypothetical protein [Stenotrophomonas]ALJ26525.1 hypothetical protein AOT14_00630 [Stenotrophomonas acidaminiphila]WHL19084.1 hypothetical protein QLF99_01175 [Stenotrophomonas acidaminiphila]WPU56249.1 hypothetical protein SQW19_01150 [Stenotrophomonas acidaminiphila]